MAARQSPPLYAPLGLLLLIGVISCRLPDVRAKAIDFWCNTEAWNSMKERTEGLKNDTASCSGSDTLSSLVHLPCVRMHFAEWANKTLQQKRTEVASAFQMFKDGVERAKNETRLQCQRELLNKLQKSIRNYLAIINKLQIQNDAVTPSPPQSCCNNTNSLSEVLTQFTNLLNGKLTILVKDLKDSMCKAGHKTTSTK